MARTTQKILDSLLKTVNKKLNRPITTYTKINDKYIPNEGNISFENCLGLQLLTINEDTSLHIEFGCSRLTKSQMEDKLRTILNTIRVMEESLISHS